MTQSTELHDEAQTESKTESQAKSQAEPQVQSQTELQAEMHAPAQTKLQTETPQSEKPANAGAARTLRMGTDSIPKLILEFSIPAVVGMLVNGAYNVIAAVFLGQAMGEIGLSVTTAALPIMTIFLAIAMLIGNGGNALAALRLGEGKHNQAEKSLGNTVSLALIVYALILVMAFCPPAMNLLLMLSSATPEIYGMTYEFVFILCIGFIFQVIGMGVNNFIRTAGAPNRALLTMVIGAVSCIAFNYLFVLVFNWGVFGCALATVFGQAASCFTVLWYFTITKNVAFKLRLKNMRLEADIVGLILSLGAASFIMQLAASVINFLVNYLLVKYGAQSPLGAENALASIGVVQRLAMFTVLPIIGIAVAIQPLLGYNYGAGFIPRVRSTLGYGLLAATIVGTLLWALIHFFSVEIVGFFGIRDVVLQDFTVFALNVQLMMLPVIGLGIVGGNYFQATGQPLKSIVLSLTRQVLFLIPLYLILPDMMPQLFPGLTSLDAIYFAAPISDGLCILTAGGFILWELGRLKRIENGEITAKFGRQKA